MSKSVHDWWHDITNPRADTIPAEVLEAMRVAWADARHERRVRQASRSEPCQCPLCRDGSKSGIHSDGTG